MTFIKYECEHKYIQRRQKKDGTYTYVFYKKYQGECTRIKFGESTGAPTLKILCVYQKILEMVENDIPRSEIKAKFGKQPNFGDFFDLFQEKHAKVHNSERHWKNNISIYNTHLKHLEKLKLSNVTRRDIQTIVDNLLENKHASTANHVIALISVMYNKAIEMNLLCQTFKSPIFHINKVQIKPRKRILEGDEFQQLNNAIKIEPNKLHAHAIQLASISGLRLGNVLAMKWDYINWRDMNITIPRTKNGNPHTINITPEIKIILNDIRRLSGSDTYLLPSHLSKTGHTVNIYNTWNKVRKHADLKNFRFHDLRRTVGSLIYQRTGSMRAVADQLGHLNLQSASIYAHNTDTITKENAINVSLLIDNKLNGIEGYAN